MAKQAEDLHTSTVDQRISAVPVVGGAAVAGHNLESGGATRAAVRPHRPAQVSSR